MYLDKNTTLTEEEKQMHITDSHAVLKQNILEQERIIAREQGVIAKYKLSSAFPIQQIMNTYVKMICAQEALSYLLKLEVELFSSNETLPTQEG